MCVRYLVNYEQIHFVFILPSFVISPCLYNFIPLVLFSFLPSQFIWSSVCHVMKSLSLSLSAENKPNVHVSCCVHVHVIHCPGCNIHTRTYTHTFQEHSTVRMLSRQNLSEDTEREGERERDTRSDGCYLFQKSFPCFKVLTSTLTCFICVKRRSWGGVLIFKFIIAMYLLVDFYWHNMILDVFFSPTPDHSFSTFRGRLWHVTNQSRPQFSNWTISHDR